MHLTKLLLIFLFFCIPLVHGNLLPTLGIPFSLSISGNFEFTKVMFFNILSGLIFLSFFVEKIYKVLFTPFSLEGKVGIGGLGWKGGDMGDLIAIIGLLILLLSTLFSTSPFLSLIGDTEKGHTALMYLNLVGLFLILKNLETSFLQKLIFTSLFSGVCISLLALKDFFMPSFDYGDLANRALGSFGHPNYLAGYLLLLFPFIGSFFPFSKETRGIAKQKRVPWGRIQVWVIFFLILVTLLLSKSIVALFLVFGYTVYQVSLLCIQKYRFSITGSVFGACSLFSLILLIFYFPEKLHSFLSRFYLWETTLGIIFSDIKIFLIGAGAETLPYFFDSFKVPEVYIYENFGYTADRAHNFFLDIWFQFGIFGVFLFLYLIFSLCKMEYPKGEGFCSLVSSTKEEGLFSSSTKISLLLFLLFGIFHYFSISSYVLLVLIFTLSQQNTSQNVAPFLGSQRKGFRYGIGFFLLLLSLTGAYFSLQLYRAELAFASGNTKLAQEIFSHPKYLIELGEYKKAEKLEGILSSQNLKEQIMTEPERQQNCDILTRVFPSAEHHFYCGNIFWNLGKEDIAKNYYRQGLQKLPDLWESDSAYWQQYFVHKSITGHRFFSPKFSDISEILQKLEIPIEGKKITY